MDESGGSHSTNGILLGKQILLFLAIRGKRALLTLFLSAPVLS